MSEKLLATQVRASIWLRSVADRVRENEYGQGAAEYAGMIIAVCAVVIAVGGAIKGYDMKTKITEALDKVFGGAAGSGGAPSGASK